MGVDVVGCIDRIIGVMTFCAGDVLTERVADIKAQAQMVVEGGVSKLGVKQGQTFFAWPVYRLLFESAAEAQDL